MYNRGIERFYAGLSSLLRAKREPEMVRAPVRAGSERFCIGAKFSFACQKRTRKAPATFEAREARTRGCSPLVTPKQKGSIQKIQVAPLEDFLCCADFESLRDGGTPTAADAASRYDLSRENAMPGGPQTARHCSIINNSSAEYAQSSAERIPIVFLRTAPQPPDAPAKRTAMPRRTGSPP